MTSVFASVKVRTWWEMLCKSYKINMGLSVKIYLFKPSTLNILVSSLTIKLVVRFTPIGGQDRSKPLPYDPHSRIETQVNDSFNKSLSNLRTTYLDSLLLHSPLDTLPRTLTAWRTLMSLQDSGKVKFIGVSNTYDVSVLQALERDGGRKVQVVQNRWFEGNHWDHDVSQYCRENNIQYQ